MSAETDFLDIDDVPISDEGELVDPDNPLGHVIARLKGSMAVDCDAAIDKDIVLLWTDDVKKVITGADLLGRLLRGI